MLPEKFSNFPCIFPYNRYLGGQVSAVDYTNRTSLKKATQFQEMWEDWVISQLDGHSWSVASI